MRDDFVEPRSHEPSSRADVLPSWAFNLDAEALEYLYAAAELTKVGRRYGREAAEEAERIASDMKPVRAEWSDAVRVAIRRVSRAYGAGPLRRAGRRSSRPRSRRVRRSRTSRGSPGRSRPQDDDEPSDDVAREAV
jgi:hypothetical protein